MDDNDASEVAFKSSVPKLTPTSLDSAGAQLGDRRERHYDRLSVNERAIGSARSGSRAALTSADITIVSTTKAAERAWLTA